MAADLVSLKGGQEGRKGLLRKLTPFIRPVHLSSAPLSSALCSLKAAFSKLVQLRRARIDDRRAIVVERVIMPRSENGETLVRAYCSCANLYYAWLLAIIVIRSKVSFFREHVWCIVRYFRWRMTELTLELSLIANCILHVDGIKLVQIMRLSSLSLSLFSK